MPANRLGEALATLDPAGPRYATDVVDRVLAEAQKAGASDVHWQPGADGMEVRWRIDGVLQPVASVPAKVAPNVVARLKVMAELLTYRTDVPQEGRIRGVAGEVEMRLSTFPTVSGEKAVVRMFAAPGRFLRLDDLGLPGEVHDGLSHLLEETSGAIVLAGPAGSGKTTTIYACLRELAARRPGERSLATLEDPVEAIVPGVSQSQVNPASGLTLEAGLKALLRQDPEVIAIGEVRDRTTAEIALQAAPDRPPHPDHVPRRRRLRGHRPVPRHGHRGLRRPQRPARRRRPAAGAPALRHLRRADEPARGLPRPPREPRQRPARLRRLPRHRIPRPHRPGRDPPARLRRDRPRHPRPRRRPPPRTASPPRPAWSTDGNAPAPPSRPDSPRPPRSAAPSASPRPLAASPPHIPLDRPRTSVVSWCLPHLSEAEGMVARCRTGSGW